MKVLVMDGVSEAGLAPLRQNSDIEVVIGKKMTEDELVEVIPQYDGMIVRSATKVTARVLEAADRLKVVGRAGVGVDNIDLEASTRKGVLVVNAPDGNTIAATEHTIAMMLALARNVPQAVAKMKEGIWDKKAFLGVELRGKTLGIVGLGRIGSSVATRAHALEMDVIGYDPFITEEKASSMAIELVSLEDLYRRADFITVHMPKTKETYRMINDKAISFMKKGVCIINCARGGIIDEEALYRAMEEGKVAGAALDVFEKEPNTESPLLKLPNFIATPHLGASTKEAQLNVAVDVSEEIVSALTGNMVKNTVNIPSISPNTLAVVKPYLGLAEKLGRFQAHLAAGRINKVEVIYSGDFAKQEVAPITTAVIKGLLDPILQEAVNFVNAPMLAKSRGIQVLSAVDGMNEGYSSLITVKVYSNKEEKTISGTLFGENDPRIVLIDGYRVDAVPNGYMLYVPHIDRPRIIGPVGTLIGDHNINIATMQVGRKQIGGKAIMLLSVDGEVPEETLKKIAELEGVQDVKLIKL
ncbi:MAG: D-3-phosphoglycerate dehydrogenase [Peptococcaceae bacterium BICA1-7]|nr:MAG: D-3-phosphoglycerate dehydrogenase [Peptococcaceae bacterium BICA1-7]HBV96316.1 phosphoglycerate dehydrogenase [Desulfotomaculum sp.]